MKQYNTVILTDLAAFYKLSLFNRIADKEKILVVFIEAFGSKRNSDFYSGERNFDFITLNGGRVAKTNKLLHILIKNKYQRVIIGGWNSFLYWIVALLLPKRKNSVIVESSIYESNIKGKNAFIKRAFSKRISKALVPGSSNQKLLEALGFKGKIVQTHGVGLYNRISNVPLRLLNCNAKRFLYVGRLSEEKNLSSLIKVFNEKSEWTLEIVGFGPLEKTLKSLAKSNIIFRGAVNNKDLYKIYQKSDVLVLPSFRETWGLVVEEAINNGVPVALSFKVGAAEDWIGYYRCGVTFDPYDSEDIKNKLETIAEKENNNALRRQIQTINFENIEKEKIEAFLSI